MAKVVQLIKRKNYKKGEILLHEGDVSDSLIIINTGSMKVYTYSREGKEQILYILTEGDFLGDINLLKKGIFDYNAIALEELDVCTLNKDDFNLILSENSEISMKILEYAYDRIAGLEKLVQTLTTKDVDSRIVELIINLSKTYGINTDEGIDIIFPLSREDMANYLGLTRETVSRRLTVLQNENIIKITGSKRILIKDFNTLKELK